MKVILGNGKTIIMCLRSDCDPDQYSVVFAKSIRLKEVLNAINDCETPEQLQHFSIIARQGIDIASVDNPLPLPKVSCFCSGPMLYLGFIDGIKRATELVNLGADTIPLQVKNEQAALLNSLLGELP